MSSKITLPPPIADGPLAVVAAFELSAYSPVDTPSGKDYEKAIKAAEKLGVAALVAALDDTACNLGSLPKNTPKLSGKAKKEYGTAREAALHARKTRLGYLHWLMGAVCGDKKGRARVIAVATSNDYEAQLRRTAAYAFVSSCDDRPSLLAFAKGLDPRTWDGKDAQDGYLKRVYCAGVTAWNAADPKGLYGACAALVAPDKLKTEQDRVRAEAVIDGLDEDSDPRWIPALAAIATGRLDNHALMALVKLPPDPRVIDGVLAYLKGGYFHDDAVQLLARVADADPARIVPVLAAALADSWMHYSVVFEGFAKAGDPSAIGIIEEWLVENATADRTKEAKAVIKALGGAKAKAKAVPKSLPKKDEPPPRERPTLVYAKIKPAKRPKLAAVAKLEADYRKMFDKAGIGEHYATIAKHAVMLHPTRVDESTIALGATKLGGHPDLPAGTKWPRAKKDPMTFLAQLRFADFAHTNLLPKTGRVALFVDDDANAEHYLEHAVGIATADDDELVRHEVPADYVARIYQACTVELIPTIRLPSPSHPIVTETLDDDQQAAYADGVYVTDAIMVQVMGYRDHGYEAEVPPKSQLLLQLPGDMQTDMEFGDADALSLFVPTKALANGNFAKVTPKIGD